MEPIFECEFVPTVPIMASRIRKRKPVPYIIFLLLSVGLLVYMTSLTLKYGFRDVWLGFFLFACGYVTYAVFVPEINAWLWIRRYRKDTVVYGPFRYTFGENIVSYQKNMQVIVEYSAIVKVERLKYTYELILGRNSAIVLVPEQFTKGSFPEFKQFLRTKRPDLQIPE